MLVGWKNQLADRDLLPSAREYSSHCPAQWKTRDICRKMTGYPSFGPMPLRSDALLAQPRTSKSWPRSPRIFSVIVGASHVGYIKEAVSGKELRSAMLPRPHDAHRGSRILKI